MKNNVRATHSKLFQSPRAPGWTRSSLVRARWRLFVAFCLVITVFELVEPLTLGNRTLHEVVDALLLCLLFFGAWVLMENLLRTIMAKSQAVELLEIKHKLSLELALAPDWDSLVDSILDFCQAQIETEGVVLLLPQPGSGRFEGVAWSQNVQQTAASNGAGLRTSIFCACDDVSEGLHDFEDVPETHEEVVSSAFCLPLKMGDRTVGRLHFYLPEGNTPSEWQTEIFNSCSSDIAIALTSAQLGQERAELLISRARAYQRRRIARDLHDTLAQKLVYLRFKLDQYSRSDGTKQLAGIQRDLVQMEVVANEAYELIRGTLAILYTDELPSLYELLMGHSKLAADRNHWQITFDEIGQPHKLPVDALQQAFYIFGEALSNIERHAAATKVDVTLAWEQAELTLTVIDDGRGFDTATAPPEGHYGLTTMRERAETLGGHIDLESTPCQGTSLTIRLPISNNQSTLPLRSTARP